MSVHYTQSYTHEIWYESAGNWIDTTHDIPPQVTATAAPADEIEKMDAQIHIDAPYSWKTS